MKKSLLLALSVGLLSGCRSAQTPLAASTAPAQPVNAPAHPETAPAPADTARQAFSLLAEGRQADAEDLLSSTLKAAVSPPAPELTFLYAVCQRSRFNIREAAPGWVHNLQSAPDSPPGQAAACILGFDYATDTPTALYCFAGLMRLAHNHPDDALLHWMAAVMARTLTRDSTYTLSEPVRRRIIAYGIDAYRRSLALFAPGPGPTLVHQTLGNLLEALEDRTTALDHYQRVLARERRPWSLTAAAVTCAQLGRWTQALALADEILAAAPDSGDAHQLRGDALWALDRSDEAIAAWQRTLAKPDANTLLPIGQRLLASGYPAQALPFLEAALQHADDDRTPILLGRAAVLEGFAGASEAIQKLGNLDWQDNPIPGYDGPSPWGLAVSSGNLADVKQLLATTSPDTPDRPGSGYTALMVAAQQGWTHVLRALLDAGARTDLVDANGDTALHFATQFYQPACVERLLAAGANPNLQDRWGQTPLIMSITGRDSRTVSRLLRQPGIDLAAAAYGGTALHYAAAYGHNPIMRELLARGAPLDAKRDRDGITPLMRTCMEFRHPDALDLLLGHGADINAQDHAGRTALRHALQATPTPPLTDRLVAHGADPLRADQDGITPLAAAHLLGYGDIAASLEAGLASPPPPLPWTRLPRLSHPANPADPSALFDAFTLPIALIEGLPLDLSPVAPEKVKTKAAQDLKNRFGIANADNLKTRLLATDRLLPGGFAGKISTRLDGRYPQLSAALERQITPLFLAGRDAPGSPLAWRKSHLIHLARLGAAAGYLPADEAARLCADAADTLLDAFGTWHEFTASFLFGAGQDAGWDHPRYEHLCKLLLSRPPADSPWSPAVWPAPSPPSAHP